MLQKYIENQNNFLKEARLIFQVSNTPQREAETSPGEDNEFEKQYQKLHGSVSNKLFGSEETLNENIGQVKETLQNVDSAKLHNFIKESLSSNVNYREYNRRFCKDVMGLNAEKISIGEQMKYAAALQLYLMQSFGRSVFESGGGLTAIDGKIGKYTLSVLAAYWNYSNTDKEAIFYRDTVKSSKYNNMLASLEMKLGHKVAFSDTEGGKFDISHSQAVEFEKKKFIADKNVTPLDAAITMIRGLEDGVDGYVDLDDNSQAHITKVAQGYQVEHRNASFNFDDINQLNDYLAKNMLNQNIVENPSV